MTDQIDQAQEFEQMRRDIALRERAPVRAMPFTGECYNCGDPVDRGCFCGTDCRDDFEFRARQNKGSGT